MTKSRHFSALTVREIGLGVATCETMQRVWRHNPESLWTIHRRTPPDGPDRLAGYFGFLHLNQAGLEALHARRLNGRAPDLALAQAGERPAAIYAWAGKRAAGTGHRSKAWSRTPWAPSATAGLRSMRPPEPPAASNGSTSSATPIAGRRTTRSGSIFRIDTVRTVTVRTRNKDA